MSNFGADFFQNNLASSNGTSVFEFPRDRRAGRKISQAKWSFQFTDWAQILQ